MRAPAKTFVRARSLRREMTLPEVQLWKLLRGSSVKGVRFRRQHPMGPYVLDFYAPQVELAVEIDGSAHDVPIKAARDLVRDGWLKTRGVRVLRFNAIDILNASRRTDVIETIAAAVRLHE